MFSSLLHCVKRVLYLSTSRSTFTERRQNNIIIMMTAVVRARFRDTMDQLLNVLLLLVLLFCRFRHKCLILNASTLRRLPTHSHTDTCTSKAMIKTRLHFMQLHWKRLRLARTNREEHVRRVENDKCEIIF